MVIKCPAAHNLALLEVLIIFLLRVSDKDDYSVVVHFSSSPSKVEALLVWFFYF